MNSQPALNLSQNRKPDHEVELLPNMDMICPYEDARSFVTPWWIAWSLRESVKPMYRPCQNSDVWEMSVQCI